MPTEEKNERRRMPMWAKKALALLVIIVVVTWAVPRFISWVFDEVTAPMTEPIGEVIGKIGGAVDDGAENFVETIADPVVETRSWELSRVDVVGDLVYDPIECPALAEVTVNVTLTETHGRLVFFTDSDTFDAAVPVKVRPCLYLDAVTENADGTVLRVDLSKMHFEPDPEAVAFMRGYIADENPANESGIERLAESGWLPIGMLQGLLQDPERTEISGLLIAIGESSAANSTCISAMMDGVREYTRQFYEDQAQRQGRDVVVEVVGEPDIYQNDYLLDTLLEAAAEKEVDFDITYRDASGTCIIEFEDIK